MDDDQGAVGSRAVGGVAQGVLRRGRAVIADRDQVRRARIRRGAEHAGRDDHDGHVRLVQQRVRHTAERGAEGPEAARSDDDLLGAARFGDPHERLRRGALPELLLEPDAAARSHRRARSRTR